MKGQVFCRRFMPIAISCFMLLSACGKKTDASDKAVSIAQNAIDVVDDYLDGDISASEASNKIKNLNDQMDYVDDMTREDDHYADDLGIAISISGLGANFLSEKLDGGDSESYDKIKEKRNDLADKVGLKKRR